MVQINLKKLISKKHIFSVIDNVIDEADASIVIQDTNGFTLMNTGTEKTISKNPGKGRVITKKYPITIDNEVIGWVMGGKKAQILAILLTYIANQEFVKKSLVKETLDKYREITLLYDISEKVAVSIELKDIAKIFIDEAKKLIRATSMSIMLCKKERLEIISAYGKEYNPKALLKVGEGIAGDVARTGKSEIINDVLTDHRFVKGNMQISSLICAPLKVKDKVIGIFNVSNESSCAYRSEELKLLCTLASQAATALENNILHENKLNADRIRTNLQRYVAPQIVKTIMDVKECNFLNPAKKDVAILFSDIRKFSSTCEKLTPEEVVAYLNEYFTQMVEIVFDQNGTVNKFVGDMIVAIFGAPSSCEDNEKQAVTTAIRMQKRLKEINIGWIKDNFHTGIGITSGEVVVGNIGSPQHMDYTAIGDKVNIAERLQSIARGGQILVDRDVYEITKNIFEFKELGSIVVKGKLKKVDVFEVIY
jgi:adenylate cyclase